MEFLPISQYLRRQIPPSQAAVKLSVLVCCRDWVASPESTFLQWRGMKRILQYPLTTGLYFPVHLVLWGKRVLGESRITATPCYRRTELPLGCFFPSFPEFLWVEKWANSSLPPAGRGCPELPARVPATSRRSHLALFALPPRTAPR